ncbi:COPII coat Sec23p-Sfb3p heterodimer component [Entomortierella beljakovae]|nr:COPII coat Sec23p-Sfb3p heterodimer component [Entomortierella beljakovae]
MSNQQQQQQSPLPPPPQQQQQQQQPRPHYPGPGLHGAQQQQPNAPGMPFNNARPSRPVPPNQFRPGPGPMVTGVRPIGPGQGTQQGRPLSGAQQNQQNQQNQQPQQQSQQQQFIGGRPAPHLGQPPSVRPAITSRPSNQQLRPGPPLQNQQQLNAPGINGQTPALINAPGAAAQPQSPPRPAMAGFQHNENSQPLSLNSAVQPHAPYQQQQPQHQQQQQQQYTPPQTDRQTTWGNADIANQMSNMQIGANNPMDQQASPSIAPPPIQSEVKPRPGTRAKRAYATDPSAAPSIQRQPGIVPPPIPQLGANTVPEQFGSQNFGQPLPPLPPHHGSGQPAPGYPPQQSGPSYQQQPHLAQQHQPHVAPQPMGQQQQFRPQAPIQPVSKSKIDPDQIPSPVAVQETDQEEWDQKPFVTSVKSSATPLASSDFMAIDGGNCNPRFFRMTTYNLPNTEDLLNTSQLPMGLVIQPLAQLRADETTIETVDFGDSGPARCRRCNAYINPFMVFTNGGQRYVCNLCLFENEIDPGYFCNLDMNGRRCDIDHRPELRNGTIEFAVPKEYWSKTPTAAAYVFAIDVSWNSIQSGMLQQCVNGIKSALWDANGVSKLAPGAQIGILTYDKNVHFYNLSPLLEQAQMMVVPDVADVFVPLSNGFLVDPVSSQTIVETLLDMLPQLFAENKTTEPVIGAVVQAVKMALESRGGKLIMFQTALPTFGPGALRQRDDSKLYNTDKERTLYAPQDDFYKDLAESCVDAGLSIDLFLFPNAYVDVATLGCLSGITGGDTFLFPNFNPSRDGVKLMGDIAKLVARPFGYNALMRVRCSSGLRIAEHFGNFHMKNATDIELAGLDSEKAFGVLVKHDGKLDERTEASFQVALLYTTADGLRRVRVHNFSTPVTTLLGNVFRWADMDTTINFLSKGAISQALSKPLNEVREALTEKCVKILSAYRRNCASTTGAGQLILPESFKLFPLYTLGMLKSKILRAGRDINIDMRVYHMRMIKNMGVGESIVYYYPRMIVVHAMDERAGVLEPSSDRVFLPPLVRVSYARLKPAGAYLLENGQKMYLWLGHDIPSQFLQETFGVQTLDEVNPDQRLTIELLTSPHSLLLKRQLPELDTETSSKLRMIRTYLQAQRARYLDLVIVRQGKDQSELEFSNLLVEDKNNEAMSYVDYLPTIHRMIQTEITTRPHEVHTSIWSR